MSMNVRAKGRLLWVGVLLLATAFVAAFAHREAVSGDGPPPLLDVVVDSCADGKHLAFRLDRPGHVLFGVEGPEDAALRLQIGPVLPLDERLGVWRPDPPRSFWLRAQGQGTRVERLDAVGSYAIRLEPIPSAMESMTSKVRVYARYAAPDAGSHASP
jgi:hypothetical protein